MKLEAIKHDSEQFEERQNRESKWYENGKKEIKDKNRKAKISKEEDQYLDNAEDEA